MAVNRVMVDAPRTDVWAVLGNGWAYSNWVVGTSHVRAVQTQWPALGSKIFHASGAWPAVTRDETRVEESEDGRRLVLTAKGGPFGAARVELTLRDDADRCEVTLVEHPVSGPGKWLHNPVSEAILVRRNTESLARLAAMCERRTAPAEGD